MSGNRRLAAAGAIWVLALAAAGSATAATPQTIYRDLADNGRLDRAYSRADLERALDVKPVFGMDAQIPRKPIRVPQASEAAPAPRATAGKADRRIPFSALDAALLVAGSVPLLLIGAGLRRRLAEPSKAQVVGG
jgi:hypothetical protein